MDIILRKRTSEHVVVFWNRTQDEEIKTLFPLNSESLEDSLILFEESLKETSSSYGKVIYFEGDYIGDIWCYSIDEDMGKTAMLSILIFEKKLWGRGIATEVTKKFIKEVFDKFNIEKIGAFIYPNNYASIGLMEKIGFVEGERFFEEGIESKYFETKKSYNLLL